MYSGVGAPPTAFACMKQNADLKPRLRVYMHVAPPKGEIRLAKPRNKQPRHVPLPRSHPPTTVMMQPPCSRSPLLLRSHRLPADHQPHPRPRLAPPLLSLRRRRRHQPRARWTTLAGALAPPTAPGSLGDGTGRKVLQRLYLGCWVGGERWERRSYVNNG